MNVLKLILLLSALFLVFIDFPAAQSKTNFKEITIDSDGPNDPWGKSTGDIDGDGRIDLIIAGHYPNAPTLWERILSKFRLYEIDWNAKSFLVWYKNPNWQKYVVSNNFRFRTDAEVADINGDGHNDIVAIADEGLFWFNNPDWQSYQIDEKILHDIEVADFDQDGDIDIVARNQSLFKHNNANILHFYRQDSPKQWFYMAVETIQGEGLKVADIDGDSKLDVIVNNFWLKNPGNLSPLYQWQPIPHCKTYTWPHVFIDTADFNNDGKLDIVLSPAEPAGKHHRISWCEAPSKFAENWIERIIDPNVESIVHSVRAGDLNNDGLTDILTAEMPQGEDPDNINIYWNSNSGLDWELETVSNIGSHSMRLVDIDGDSYLDFFGANWRGENEDIKLWKNLKKNPSKWRRHVIDDKKPWQSVFVMTADIDNDGRNDIASGGYWYKNPGNVGKKWKRRKFGKGAHNVALLHDFNNDGNIDALASTWKRTTKTTIYERFRRKLGFVSNYLSGSFVWCINNGSGKFQVMNNIERGDGDFLQGITIIEKNEEKAIALSWHKPEKGLQKISIPTDPLNDTWSINDLSIVSQDEELSSADIDKDGDLDLFLGTHWLRNDNNSWSMFVIHDTKNPPDRNRVVDLDNNGSLDVIIGYQAISKLGK